MRRWSGGRWGFVLGTASALVSACGSSSGGVSPGASGAAGAAAGASAQQGGSSGTGANGGTNANGGTSANGGSGASGGAGGVGQGGTGAGSGGTPSGGTGGAGGVQNAYIDQIIIGQGGGPPRCFPRSIPTGLPGSANDGQATCFIAELKPGSCDCSQTARAPLPAQSLTASEKILQETGACGGTTGVSCDTFCGCEIVQTPGTASDQSSDLYACQNDVTPAASVNGFCVIDQMRTDANGAPSPLGNPAVVSECPSNQKRLLRFLGAGNPASGTSVFIGCTSS